MEERITKIQTQWTYLVEKSSEKSQHLKEAYQQQQFGVNVKDLDFWLGEVKWTEFVVILKTVVNYILLVFWVVLR